jgi:hypothetical protein
MNRKNIFINSQPRLVQKDTPEVILLILKTIGHVYTEKIV